MSALSGFSERALPATLIPTRPKAILPGITQEQLQIINQNTIAQPTPYGTEIQIYLPQLSNTFLDTQSTYFVVHATASFASNTLGPVFGNDCNGAVIGSFYSLFHRMSVYANSVNLTDDIFELGMVAIQLLRITMTRTARLSMAHMLGFQNNIRNISALASYRIWGSFPNSGREDGYYYAGTNDGTNNGPDKGWATANLVSAFPCNPQMFPGYPRFPGSVVKQDFDFAIPVIGSLGVTNPNPYYMGLGNTRISLFTEDPTRFFLLPPVQQRTTINVSNTQTTENATVYAGGLVYQNDFAITRIRFEGNIIRLDNTVWGQLMPLIMAANGNRLVSNVTSFTVSTQTLPLGTSGLQQPQMQIRKGSVKSVICLFNNVGACNNAAFTNLDGTTATQNLEIVNYFNKWGSINPGLGANTLFLVNNVNYPKLGLDPTNYPNETFAYILDSINMLITANMKPSICPQNWLCADPAVISPNAGTSLSAMWRSGVILQQPQLRGYGGAFAGEGYFSCSPWFRETLVTEGQLSSSYSLGLCDEILSNDFFLYFTFEDQPRPGMLSGKSTMDGSNYLNMPLIASTTYAYNVYFIAAFDALCVHELDTQNVYYVS